FIWGCYPKWIGSHRRHESFRIFDDRNPGRKGRGPYPKVISTAVLNTPGGGNISAGKKIGDQRCGLDTTRVRRVRISRGELGKKIQGGKKAPVFRQGIPVFRIEEDPVQGFTESLTFVLYESVLQSDLIVP